MKRGAIPSAILEERKLSFLSPFSNASSLSLSLSQQENNRRKCAYTCVLRFVSKRHGNLRICVEHRKLLWRELPRLSNHPLLMSLLSFFQKGHGYRLDSLMGARECLNGATVFAAKWRRTQHRPQVPGTAPELRHDAFPDVRWRRWMDIGLARDGPDKTDGDAVSHIRSLIDSGNSNIPPPLFERLNNASLAAVTYANSYE